MENPFEPLPISDVAPSDQPVWRDGDRLCTRNGAVWPCRCAVCGQDTSADNPIKIPLQWHPRWVYFLVILSLWLYLIASMFTRRRANIQIFLCEEHRARRRNGQALLIGAVVVGLGLIGMGIGMDRPGILAMGVLGLLGGLIPGLLMMRAVRALKIEGDLAWVRAGDGFAATL